MTEPKFTRGPWNMLEIETDPDGPSFIIMPDFKALEPIARNVESYANAALIAAAPELYEALEKMVAHARDTSTNLGRIGRGIWAMEYADRALARARGEKP